MMAFGEDIQVFARQLAHAHFWADYHLMMRLWWSLDEEHQLAMLKRQAT